MTEEANVARDFSHKIEPKSVTADGRLVELAPTQEQCETIAERLDLIALRNFTAKIQVGWESGGDTLRLEGSLHASVVQQCVATLKPITSDVEDRFVERYALKPEETDQEIIVSADDELDLDAIPDDGLDLAEIAVQQLSLALDPYPRHEDADDLGLAVDDDEKPSGPFAKLAMLKGGKA